MDKIEHGPPQLLNFPGAKELGLTRDGLQILPLIDEALIVAGSNPLVGEIKVGEIFAWEPGLEHARLFVLVTEIRDGMVFSRLMNRTGECWNEESRFRQACHRTYFSPMSARRDGERVPAVEGDAGGALPEELLKSLGIRRDTDGGGLTGYLP